MNRLFPLNRLSVKMTVERIIRHLEPTDDEPGWIISASTILNYCRTKPVRQIHVWGPNCIGIMVVQFDDEKKSCLMWQDQWERVETELTGKERVPWQKEGF